MLLTLLPYINNANLLSFVNLRREAPYNQGWQLVPTLPNLSKLSKERLPSFVQKCTIIIYPVKVKILSYLLTLLNSKRWTEKKYRPPFVDKRSIWKEFLYLLGVDIWQTTHLPLPVYVVFELPLVHKPY